MSSNYNYIEIHESLADESERRRRETVALEYALISARARQRRHDEELKPWVDRGGFNVMRHLVDLVDVEGIHPDTVNAMADLFVDADDFRQAVAGPQVGPDVDPRIVEATLRLAAYES